MAEDADIQSDNEENNSSLTLRGISSLADQNASAQAKKAGKPKGTLVREFIEEGLGDPLANFARTNPVSISLDEELAEYVGAKINDKSYQNYSSSLHNEVFRLLLNLNKNSELKSILLANTPCLFTRADQVLVGSESILRGVSLTFALFCELASRDRETIEQGWKRIFRSEAPGAHERYLQQIDEIRRIKKLDLFNPAIELSPEWGNIRVYRPESYDHGAWRVLITLNNDKDNIEWSIRFPVLNGRLLTADPGYSGMAGRSSAECQPGFRFINRRCELHLYTNGISEDENPITPQDVIHHLVDAIESNML
ncbi:MULTISPECIES: hypothetical protein [unclassified Brenneria]|uniref:hypothetical protein n=1 Tax=unclassified Brenneria TaxID=2634434 RepID=UPI0029C40AC9|nr:MULTISPECIES: hypothetical protein [unclassified Brenneria]MDX5628408.1 hypothetical protein [Brenneria sp. L3-3Z]MDX5695409.1 hypothetical protein [Brenneria sp. L4-2C]